MKTTNCLGLLLAALFTVSCGNKAATTTSTDIHVVMVETVPLDPEHANWGRMMDITVDVLPQQIAFPTLKEAAVKKLNVRALADKQWLGLRLEWEDAGVNDMLETDKFTDGVAVEFPLGDPAKSNPMMGDPQNPVYILHWKAAWQRDIDKGRADVQDLHPGYWADPYPFVAGGHPYPVQESFESANSRRYLPGVAAGNPVSKISRQYPVEELHAEGFGSLADHRFQDARGKGVWANGKWRVVLLLPRESSDPANPKFAAKSSTSVALAVWEGKAKNVGGRKHWAPFTTIVMP